MVHVVEFTTTCVISGFNQFQSSTFVIVVYCQICIAVPSQELDFQHHMSWSFYVHFFEVRGVCFRFVDLGGIVNDHEEKFLFKRHTEMK